MLWLLPIATCHRSWAFSTWIRHYVMSTNDTVEKYIKNKVKISKLWWHRSSVISSSSPASVNSSSSPALGGQSLTPARATWPPPGQHLPWHCYTTCGPPNILPVWPSDVLYNRRSCRLEDLRFWCRLEATISCHIWTTCDQTGFICCNTMVQCAPSYRGQPCTSQRHMSIELTPP